MWWEFQNNKDKSIGTIVAWHDTSDDSCVGPFAVVAPVVERHRWQLSRNAVHAHSADVARSELQQVCRLIAAMHRRSHKPRRTRARRQQILRLAASDDRLAHQSARFDALFQQILWHNTNCNWIIRKIRGLRF